MTNVNEPTFDINELRVKLHFSIKSNPKWSTAVCAIKVLLEYIKHETFGTITELREKVIRAIEVLMQTENSAISIKSGCELLLRFITLTALDAAGDASMIEYKEILLKNGEVFLAKCNEARDKITSIACSWILNGSNILTHSKSRVVFDILKAAKTNNVNFHVYVCESHPDMSGNDMALALREVGISTTVIVDAAVGACMEKIDFVLLGAEGVVESGGIINKIGTNTVALCAKMLNKPVYVGVESFKIVRFYPLNNSDLPDCFKYKNSTIRSGTDLDREHPMIDYTNPSLLTLLFTDLGVLSPSAISDELVKLYL